MFPPPPLRSKRGKYEYVGHKDVLKENKSFPTALPSRVIRVRPTGELKVLKVLIAQQLFIPGRRNDCAWSNFRIVELRSWNFGVVGGGGLPNFGAGTLEYRASPQTIRFQTSTLPPLHRLEAASIATNALVLCAVPLHWAAHRYSMLLMRSAM